MTAIICRETGWDYETYLSQPKWLISNIIQLINKKNG